MKREELLARARRHLWAAWALSSEELGSQAADTLMGLGMLVPEGGAAELQRLRSRVVELEQLLAEAPLPVTLTARADGITRRIAPTQALQDDVTPQVSKLRGLLAGQRAVVEDPHDGPLHRDYLVSRELPELGGGR